MLIDATKTKAMTYTDKVLGTLVTDEKLEQVNSFRKPHEENANCEL